MGFKLKTIHERFKSLAEHRIAIEGSAFVLVQLDKTLEDICKIAEQTLEQENKFRQLQALPIRKTISVEDFKIALSKVFHNGQKQE